MPTRSSIVYCLTILPIFLAAVAIATAEEPIPIPVLIGSPIDLDTGATSNVGGVSLAYNSMDEEYRVVWFDSRIAGENDVYAQRVSLVGALLGDNVPMAVGPTSKTDTAVAYDPANNRYFVTWQYQGGDPGSPGFNHSYGGLASATSGLLDTPFDVSNGGLEGTLAYNSTNAEFFLEARNFAGGGAAGIRGQRVSAAGQLVGPNLTIASAGAPAPAGHVAYNANTNQYLATWRDQVASDLKGRIINADGTFATAPFTISAVFPESLLAASVAFDPIDDHYLVVFGTAFGGPLLGQFVRSSGALEGNTFVIVPGPGRLNPFVAYQPIWRSYLIAWWNSDNQDLKALLLHYDNHQLGPALSIATGTAMGLPRVAAGASGGFLVAWTDWKNWPTRVDVLAQLVGVRLPGDLNCDGAVDFGDIDPFVLALSDPPAYQAAYPNCNILNGDCNGDGQVDFGDIDPFVALLSGG